MSIKYQKKLKIIFEMILVKLREDEEMQVFNKILCRSQHFLKISRFSNSAQFFLQNDTHIMENVKNVPRSQKSIISFCKAF